MKKYCTYYVYEVYTDHDGEDYTFYEQKIIYKSKNKNDCIDLCKFLNKQVEKIYKYDNESEIDLYYEVRDNNKQHSTGIAYYM